MTRSGKPLRLVWLAAASRALERAGDGYTSTHASFRYRMTIPHAALRRLGCESSVATITSAPDFGRVAAQLKQADVVVLGKVVYQGDALQQLGPRLLALIEKLRAGGARVMADFSDDIFAHPQVGAFNIALANSVDAAVASTPGLADVVRTFTPVPVHVVTDPVEGLRREPRAPSAERRAPLSLLWFGHSANFDTLLAGLQQLEPAAAEHPFSLVAITSQGPAKMAALAELDAAWQGAGRTCRFRPWSVQAVFDALQECDAVIIPSDPNDPAKRVKSPNRFTESVWAGRAVLAHPVPAYLLLDGCGWVGDDLKVGLRWLAQNPAQALERIREGQAVVARDYCPEAVGRAWQNAIRATAGR